MNAFFKGLVGASVLLGATAMSASAQDYTWTLYNMHFQDVVGFSGGTGTENTDASASGTIVVHRNGSNYEVKSFNVTTTAGTTGGSRPTGFNFVYNSALGMNSTSSAIALDEFVELFDDADETFRLHLGWNAGALFDEMDGSGNLNAVVTLDPFSTYEQPYALGPGANTRYSGQGFCVSGGNQGCSGQTPGYLKLTAIDVPPPPRTATPEPASMALLGAGILGLVAARRRRAA